MNASPETQKIFNEALKKNFTLSFESWTTYKKPVNTGKELQLNFGSESNDNAPLFLRAAHQRIEGINQDNPAENLSNNRFNKAIFEKCLLKNVVLKSMVLDMQKILSILTTQKKNYLSQNGRTIFFFKKYVGYPQK